jgi:hypothetical protein
MDDNLFESTKNLKKSYQKPVLQRVSLMPQEAVLAGCKATFVADGIRGALALCSVPTNCVTIGS